MTVANWKTQPVNNIQSLLFNNPRRVIKYLVRKGHDWVDRAATESQAVRLFDLAASDDRTCLRTIQFVHHMLIPPGGRHVAELHIHPDAEELAIVTQGRGEATIAGQTRQVATNDVIYIGPNQEHLVANTSDELLGVLFVNVPVGQALKRLAGEEVESEA